jgi:hypothetical protein
MSDPSCSNCGHRRGFHSSISGLLRTAACTRCECHGFADLGPPLEFRACGSCADLRADLALLTAVADAAERVSAQWQAMGRCYIGAEQNAALADLLDALAARMPEVQR